MSHLNAMLRDHIAHVYQNAPAIRYIMEQAGVTTDDIKTVADLAKIPVTSKDTLQQWQQDNPPFGGFLAVTIRELKRIFLSPGPIYDPQGYLDEAALQIASEMFIEQGFTPDDVVLNTFMYHLVPAGLLFDDALTRMGATVIPTGPGNADIQIKVMLDLQPTAYTGTPSFLEMLLEKAEQMGVTLPIEKAFFSAEPYFPAQRQLFEGKYGIQTGQAYASADLGIIAYERPNYTGWYIPRHLIVQICDPHTGEVLPDGEPGEVVVTSFNRAYALIRFGTGDLSIKETEANGREKLMGLLGRSGEAIKVRGMFLHPNAIRKAASQFDNIQNIQAVIGREGSRDTVQLQVILKSGSLDANALKNAVKEEARLSIDTVEIVDALEGSRTVRDTRVYQ